MWWWSSHVRVMSRSRWRRCDGDRHTHMDRYEFTWHLLTYSESHAKYSPPSILLLSIELQFINMSASNVVRFNGWRNEDETSNKFVCMFCTHKHPNGHLVSVWTLERHRAEALRRNRKSCLMNKSEIITNCFSHHSTVNIRHCILMAIDQLCLLWT